MLGLGVHDSTAGFRAYSAGILRRLDLDRIQAEGYGFQIEMTYRAKQNGAAVCEVPISFVDRAAGESKMSTFIVMEALALVTWWGLGRLWHALGASGAGTDRETVQTATNRRRRTDREEPDDDERRRDTDESGAVSRNGNGTASETETGTGDPVRSA